MSDTPPPMMPMSQKLVFKKVQKSTLNRFILIQCYPVTKIFFDLSKERFLKRDVFVGIHIFLDKAP